VKKYTNDYVEKFFCESNLNCYKLGKILDISNRKIARYLFGDGHVKPEEAMLIDAAIMVVESQHLRQPEWNIGDWRQGRLNGIHGTKLDDFNRDLRKMAEEQKRRTEENAANIIVWILSDKEGHNEFLLNRDPLFYGGLESYGLREFKRRAERLISEIV